MSKSDEKLNRLLRSAALTRDENPTSLPFGFDTRVVALWRSIATKPNGLANLLRNVALISVTVAVVAAVGAFWEIRQSREIGEPFSNEFAIADSAIQSEFGR
jgi:hypothetical protein